MRKSIMQGALLAVLLLGFAIPATAVADKGGKGCSNLGTWFGVAPYPPVMTPPPWENIVLTGYYVTVTGKSNNKGTNNFEYPVFDPSLAMLDQGYEHMPPFNEAVRIGSMRGNWKRTGGNTFDYTFMGFAFKASGMPAYVAKISGQVVLVAKCQYQYTTAVMEVFLPSQNPFEDTPIETVLLGEFYAYRAKVDLPD